MDAGEVILDGKKIEINNPDEAMAHGIAMVHQELQPVLARSVGENLYLGRFPVKKYGPIQIIDHKTMYAEAEKWLKEIKMEFDPKAQLSAAGQVPTYVPSRITVISSAICLISSILWEM